jgi:cobalt-zinc-cadmium efflux system outer membrane protein
MSARWAAILAAVSLYAAHTAAQESRVLTLEDAFARALAIHPDLARYDPLRKGAAAVVDAEALRPPLRLELELENAPRSNQDSALDTAETTLSLASVFERGGKREARIAVATAAMSTIELQLEQRRADLLAEVARRYLDLIEAQSLADLADVEVSRREKTVEATSQRVRAGATPESVRLAAEAALARAVLQRDRLRAEGQAAAVRLAILWKSREPDFARAVGDPFKLLATPTLASLRELLASNPDLRRFADEHRVREARVQLARSARATDIDWRLGVRRLEEDGSWAAVAGVSVPLGSARRADPGIRQARFELAALGLEKEAEELTLEATLVAAHMRLTSASAEVNAFRDVLLPKYAQAERASERAFRAGALTYTEWTQLQSDASEARREQLLAAIEAHRALIEIQRLTGSPFTTSRTQP